MIGFFFIHRKLFNHWLWKSNEPYTRREAWIWLIGNANWEDKKFMIKGSLYECKRGQLAYSISEYQKQWGWTEKKVRCFFDLLKKDNMIVVNGLKYTTLLTICNYDNYNTLGANSGQTQGELMANSGQTQGELMANSGQTQGDNLISNKDNNSNKVNKENKKSSSPSPDKKEKIKILENVSMTETEIENLKSRFTETKYQKCLEKLDNYKGATGKKYASDFRAILTWVSNAIDEEEAKQQKNKPAATNEGEKGGLNVDDDPRYKPKLSVGVPF